MLSCNIGNYLIKGQSELLLLLLIWYVLGEMVKKWGRARC